jgi:hypothetical protein
MCAKLIFKDCLKKKDIRNERKSCEGSKIHVISEESEEGFEKEGAFCESFSGFSFFCCRSNEN